MILDDTKEITVTVTVPSSFKTKAVSFDKNSVTVANVPDGYKANVISVNANQLTLVGSQSSLNNDKIGVGLVVIWLLIKVRICQRAGIITISPPILKIPRAVGFTAAIRLRLSLLKSK